MVAEVKGGFLFITGIVRALERRRLSDDMVSSMIERPDTENIREILRTTYYRDLVPEGTGYFSSDSFLLRCREWALSLATVYGMADLAFLFRVPRDYHNIRTVLRGLIFSTRQEGFLSREGMIDAGRMRAILEDKRYDELPGLMGQAASEAVTRYHSTRSILHMDLCLDSWLAEDLLGRAQGTGSSMVLKHQRLAVDAANSGIFLRAGAMRNEESLRDVLYIRGGYVDAGVFLKCRSAGELALVMESSDMHSVLARGIREYEVNVFAPEREADRMLFEALDDAAFMIDGPEPLYAFLCRAEHELRVLGMILSAGAAGRQFLRMRLGEIN